MLESIFDEIVILGTACLPLIMCENANFCAINESTDASQVD